MKRKWIALYFLLLFLPYLIVLIIGKIGLLTPEEPAPEKPAGYTVSLYRHESGTIETVELRDYLWGVVAGEMPASYPEEALKAQTVASYSYLLYRKNTIATHPNSDFGHPGDICDDPDHCKAYLTLAEATARWGEDWQETAEPRIRNAVEAVLGVTLLYEDAPANAVFHAISGGRTEDAEDVWGAEVPYLRSMDSHWDEEAKGFSSEVTIPIEGFRQKLEQTDCTPGAITLTKGGSVATFVFGDKTYTGRELRTLFGLRSTRFTLTLNEQEAIFQVSGYGHQVGMSQYGASVLAKNGYTYQEILLYYYTGCTTAADYYPSYE